MVSKRSRSRLLRYLTTVLLIALLFTLYQHQHLTTKLAVYLPDYIQPDDCLDYPDFDNVTIVVKTGATEAGRLIPTLLRTSLRCIKDPIIVSDLDQTINGVRLHNVLAEFAPRAMERNSDFDIYRLQQQYQADGKEKDIPGLASMPLKDTSWRTPGKSAAWGLDKYKNIRMVELAWRLQPEREWYLFIDADTYLIWNSLLAWLPVMDHRQQLYIGQPVRMREHKHRPLDFAYGGAGILLSQAAVRTYALERPGLAHRWDRRIQGWWFGDFLLADALDEELDLQVTDGTPMMGGDSPAVMAYGPHNWCRPVVTLHHLNSNDAKALYKLEREKGSSLLRGKDVYHGVPHDDLPRMKENWDNHAGDTQYRILPDSDVARFAHISYEACQAACQNEDRCFQFVFVQMSELAPIGAVRSDGKCFLSSAFRLGEQRQIEQSGAQQQIRKTWTSGWNLVRILAFTALQDNCTDSKDLWTFGPGIIADKA